MIYQFIHDFDLKRAIRRKLLDQVTDSDGELIKEAEERALAQVRSKLGQRYNMAEALPTILTYDNSAQYNEGDQVYREYTDGGKDYGFIYRAREATTGNAPESSPNDWQLHDPRHQLLVMYVIDMLLYHLHARITPRNVPEVRNERYAAAVAWMDMVKAGDESPDLPLRDPGRDEVRHGNRVDQQDWSW